MMRDACGLSSYYSWIKLFHLFLVQYVLSILKSPIRRSSNAHLQINISSLKVHLVDDIQCK